MKRELGHGLSGNGAVWWFGAAGLTLGCLLWEVFWWPGGSGLEVTFYSHFASNLLPNLMKTQHPLLLGKKREKNILNIFIKSEIF